MSAALPPPAAPPPGPPSRGRAIRAAWPAILLLVSLLPIVVVRYPPLHDYPAHEARLSILRDWSQGEGFHRFYEVQKTNPPNMASDLLVLRMAERLPLEAALKILILLSQALTVLGVILIRRALGLGGGVPVLLALILLYNGIFLMGFLNFGFTVGLGLCLFGLWISVRKRGGQMTGLCFALPALLLYYFHLAAFGLYAVAVAVFEASLIFTAPFSWKKLARIGLTALQFLAPAILFAGFNHRAAGDGSGTLFVDSWLKIRQIRGMFHSGNLTLDGCTALTLFALLGLLLWRKAVLTERRGFGTALLAVLALIYVFSPAAYVESYFLDQRLLVGGLFFVLGALPFEIGEPRLKKAALIVLSGLVLARAGTLLVDWRSYDRRYREILSALDRVSEESIVFTATVTPTPIILSRGDWNGRMRPPLHFAVCYLVERRRAFVPLMLADSRHHRLAIRPEWRLTYHWQERRFLDPPLRSQLEGIVGDIQLLLRARAASFEGRPAPPVYLLVWRAENYRDALPPDLTVEAREPTFLLLGLPPA